MIDATHIKAPPRRGEPVQKGAEYARAPYLRSRLGWQAEGLPRRIGRTKGGLNSKLHTFCDGQGRPVVMLLTEGEMSDHAGAAFLLDAPSEGDVLIADRG